MALYVYNDGDHPAGFIGVRVVWTVDGQYLQKYFNFRTRDKKAFVSRCEEKALIEQAKDLERRWQQQSARIQYQRLLTENHANTLPFQGLGFTGITLMIHRDADYRRIFHRPLKKADFPYFTPGFRVARTKTQRDLFFNIHKLGLDRAWRDAVNCWAKRNGVKPKDKQRILTEKRPSRDQFKQLRRHLNKQGWDIPIVVVNGI